MLTPEELQDVLGKCHNLTDLNFERNGTQFTCFTGTKVQLLTQKLEAALTFLPSQIGALTALKRLNVDGNNLIQVCVVLIEP